MNPYRTHTCGVLRPEHIGQTVRLAGWVHRKRDHGNLLFIDLRDHFGLTQCVVTPESAAFAAAEGLRNESVISVAGRVVGRTDGERQSRRCRPGTSRSTSTPIDVLSTAETLPFQVSGTQEIPEEQRLRYRFLDLRREKIHANIVLRSRVINSIRRRMQEQGFLEFQTPILTSSSPEGARDYLVPSRLHPGKFYALPQAPQQFKQLLMVSGFDRYFQIAPCFRDEDARADRSPGEFYQLDVEMSFVTQDDVFAAIEPVLAGVFRGVLGLDGLRRRRSRASATTTRWCGTAATSRTCAIRSRPPTSPICSGARPSPSSPRSWPRGASSARFRRRAPPIGRAAFSTRPSAWASRSGSAASPTSSTATRRRGRWRSTCPSASARRSSTRAGVKKGDAVFFVAGPAKALMRAVDGLRAHLGRELDLIEPNAYRFCWITDFPFYELRRGDGAGGVQPQSVLDAAGRPRRAQHAGPADDQGLPVRHRLQRRRAVERRDPEPPAGCHAARVRDRRVRAGRGGAALWRHARGVPLRRAAARRAGARHRPHRDAAGAASRTSARSSRFR